MSNIIIVNYFINQEPYFDIRVNYLDKTIKILPEANESFQIEKGKKLKICAVERVTSNNKAARLTAILNGNQLGISFDNNSHEFVINFIDDSKGNVQVVVGDNQQNKINVIELEG